MLKDRKGGKKQQQMFSFMAGVSSLSCVCVWVGMGGGGARSNLCWMDGWMDGPISTIHMVRLRLIMGESLNSYQDTFLGGFPHFSVSGVHI